jgi:hypothetical protein
MRPTRIDYSSVGKYAVAAAATLAERSRSASCLALAGPQQPQQIRGQSPATGHPLAVRTA